MARRKSSSRRRASPERNLSLGNLFNRQIFSVTDVGTGGRRLLGGGIRGAIGAIIALVLSAAVSVTALVLISLVYTQLEAVASQVTTYAVAALSLGTVALALQVLGAFIRPGAGWGATINLLIMASYIVAGVLSLLVAVGLPQDNLQTYALIAAAFYIFIGGAYL
jgi:hypothetical protein